MSPATLATYVRRKTHTDTTTYPNADLLVDANIAIEEIASAIQRKRPDVWHMPTYMNLEANRREYALPTHINGVHSLEIKFDTNYVYATPLKERPSISLSEDVITANYTNENPYYFLRRNALFILSGTIAAVTDGLGLISSEAPAPITDITSTTDLSDAPSTTTHGFPGEFHDLLARRITVHYKDINTVPLNREDQQYEQDLEKRIEEYAAGVQTLERMIQTPKGHFNNGYDL